MDPNATLQRIREALADQDGAEALAAVADLRQWLQRGGFRPDYGRYGYAVGTFCREHLPLRYAPTWAELDAGRDAAGADVIRTAEHCQYCGNSWQQTRTVGTPRLDAVPCPSCKRLV